MQQGSAPHDDGGTIGRAQTKERAFSRWVEPHAPTMALFVFRLFVGGPKSQQRPLDVWAKRRC
eukprot:scaffold3886_cov399-Prasinococcus_capsulatus_cf.AAC.5